MSIIGGLTTVTRGFGELFGKAHDALGDIQKSMASLLPAMPGLPVGKFFDISLGIDFHPIVFPWPLPICPVPHVGMIFDLTAAIMSVVAPALPSPESGPGAVICNFAKGMAPSVKVHGQWIAQAGISIVHLPGLLLHLLPTVAGKAEAEMWMGSSIVLADGGPCSTQFHPALSCNLVGAPPLPRKGKTYKAKSCLMAPTALLSIITSTGKPVLVGGPPTIDLFQLALKLGMKGLGKMWKKAGDKFQDLIDKLVEKNGGNKTKLTKILQAIKCKTFGEPVDAATGRTYQTNTDFELPGPIPIVWSRTYYSDAEVNGPLGYNWHHSYNISIRNLNDEVYILRHVDGRESGLPVLQVGESYFDRKEQLWWSRDEKGYQLQDASKLYYRFETEKNRFGYCPVSGISTADGYHIAFEYGYKGDLEEIIDSRKQRLFVTNDHEGRITDISTWYDGEEVHLVRYHYDDAGNLVETLDAMNVRKTFGYSGHLLVKLTNQSGMSFHWEYEGHGNDARCIHTWGDGGIQEYFIEYGKGYTRTRNGEGAVTEYYYTADNLIYKIVDANGGVTHQHYNEYEELELVVDPEGFSRKSKYDDYGNLIQQTNENGESLSLGYDERQNLTRAVTPGGKVLKWKYDEYDRIIRRELPSGEALNYTYEENRLKYITDKKKRRFELDFNEKGELQRLTYPNGIYRNWKYDKKGRVTEATDVKGNRTVFHYDIMDRVVKLQEADGNIHHFKYDVSGNLIHATDKLREVEFTYGPLGILTGRKQGNRMLNFGYNTELQLVHIRNEKYELYEFELDGLGQVIAEYGFDNLERRYDRDGLGRVKRVIRPVDRWTRYEYDGTGNVVKEEQYDGKVSLYSYDRDGGLLKAHNDSCKVDFKRDKAGRIVEDRQDAHTVSHEFDEEGNCIHTTSNLGADIQNRYTGDGYLETMCSGDTWQADWERDETGLESRRKINSGLEIHTWRDNLGREINKRISGKGNITSGSYSYDWGMNNRLLKKTNDLTELVTTFEYNEFDDLIRADYREGKKVETIYRTPDRIGALYKTWTCRDREYDKGGKLLEDPEYYYHYDAEGNLIFKEYRKPNTEAVILINKKQRAKDLGIEYRGSGTGWQYDWYSNGMLKRVVRPDGKSVEFWYDALGRRTAKFYNGKLTRWVWNGNTPLHECMMDFRDMDSLRSPILPDDENLITWIFEDGTFVPAAKITKDEQYTIVTDYLGTPVQMYNQNAEKTWDCTLDIYGKVRIFEGSSLSDCPFRYQGQYEDEEIGLYYNRFRYYSSDIGSYISQDPIGLVGGFCLFGYVGDVNEEIDIFGLSKSMSGKARARAIQRARKLQSTTNPPRMTSASVSRKTGRVYYGDSGVESPKISAEMKSRMDFDTKQGWDIENCAEFNSVNKATLKGEKISDLDVYTVEVETLNPRVRCDNCQVTTEGAHVKSDFDGKH